MAYLFPHTHAQTSHGAPNLSSGMFLEEAISHAYTEATVRSLAALPAKLICHRYYASCIACFDDPSFLLFDLSKVSLCRCSPPCQIHYGTAFVYHQQKCENYRPHRQTAKSSMRSLRTRWKTVVVDRGKELIGDNTPRLESGSKTE